MHTTTGSAEEASRPGPDETRFFDKAASAFDYWRLVIVADNSKRSTNQSQTQLLRHG